MDTWYTIEAEKAARNAQNSPRSWHGHPDFSDEVVYADGVFSVGGYGNASEYNSIEDAIADLAEQWEIEDDYRDE